MGKQAGCRRYCFEDKREECSRRNFGDKRAAGRRPGHKGRRAFHPFVPGDRQEAQRLGYPHIQRVLPAPRSRRQRNYLGRYSLDKQARTATRTDLIRLRRKFPLQRCQGSCFPAAQENQRRANCPLDPEKSRYWEMGQGSQVRKPECRSLYRIWSRASTRYRNEHIS